MRRSTYIQKYLLVVCLACVSLQPFYAHEQDTLNTEGARRIPPPSVVKRIKTNFVNLLLLRDSVDLTPIPLDLKQPSVRKGPRSVQVTWKQWDEVVDTSASYKRDTINADGSFKNLTNNGRYQYIEHAKRLLDMATYYALWPNNRPTLPDSFRIVTDYLLKNLHTFSSQGWYFDSLYVPGVVAKAALILENELRGDERRLIVKLLDKRDDSYTGENKMWYETNQLMKALLTDSTNRASSADTTAIGTARNHICALLMQKDSADGIQQDWCFHQHKFHIQQFGNYGLEFIKDISLLSQVFRNTPFSLKREHYMAFDSLMREGFRYVLWHGFMDVPSIGRTVTKDRQRIGALCVGEVARRMYNFPDSSCHKTGERILLENFVTPDSLQPFVGHKYFTRSNYTIHRTPRWMISVKMSSKKISGTEMVNGNNLWGYYQGDGATYTQVNGKEYLYVFPLWDWRKIPGITCYDTIIPIDSPQDSTHWYNTITINNTSLVGGIAAGDGGISAMEVNRDNLRAHKAWFFTDSCMFCMGYVFASPGSKTTSIEQCMQQGDLYYNKSTGWVTLPASISTFSGDSVRLFMHNNIGYITWGPVTAKTGERSGSWGSFMSMYPPDTVDTGDVFSLYLSHRANEPSTYQYLLLPAMSLQEIKNFKTERIKVLRNDSIMQAVLIDDKLYVAAFAAGTIHVNRYRNYTITEPGVYYYNSSKELFDTNN